MKRHHFIALLALVGLASCMVPPVVAAQETKETRCYELRIYHAAEGKLEALNTRFREHTTELFTRHGMTNVVYWTPIENPERLLIYLLSYPNLAAREASWKAFQADPDWIAVRNASEVSGALVDRVENRFLTATDFSQELKVDRAGVPHTFEMRTYTASPGNLPRLLDRFRQHTVAIFSKHGMGHLGYFTPSTGQPGADNTLIYFLYHASPEARKNSFAAFGMDSEWVKIKSDSEAAAGGPLTIAGGVKSELLKASDFSPIK